MKNAIAYKVTALRPVLFLANVREVVVEGSPRHQFRRMREQKEWIRLDAGHSRDGLGMVFGVEPSGVPDPLPAVIAGFSVASLGHWKDSDLPKEFFGLLRLELSSASPG